MDSEPVSRPLPHYTTPLIGRETEHALMVRLIRDPSIELITITGSAGIGKTRLAITIANQFAGHGTDGVKFVSLATVTDPQLVAAEVARAHDIQADDLVSAVRDHWSRLEGIVVLDNLEQVINSATDIAAMLPANPDFTLIVTSQRPLQIEGEHVLRLEPLALPQTNANTHDAHAAPSVQLLVERASSHDASFVDSLMDSSTSEAVIEICRRLDGIPLAIELAASRLASLSPEVVLAQLEHGQQILSTTRRDAPERQRTMHTALSWSYQLLPQESQRIFLWLGAFSSGFDLNIVEALSRHLKLSTPAVDTISELMNFSLIRRVSGGTNPWYVMLVSIREFCLTELGITSKRADAQSYVADYVVDLAEHTEAELTGPHSGPWSAMLDRQFSTIRASVTWSLKHADPVLPMQIAIGMRRYLEQEGRWQEAINWIDQSTTWRDKLTDEQLIGGLITKLTLQEDVRDLSGARGTAAEVKDLLSGKDFPKLEAYYLLRVGNIEQDQGNLDEAKEYYQRSLEIAERHALRRDRSIAHGSLGFIAYFHGDFATAEQYFLQVKTTLEEIEDYPALATLLSNLAAATINLGQPERALQYLDQSAEIHREFGGKRDLIYTLLNMASTLIILKRFDEAEHAAEEAVQLARGISHRVLEAAASLNLSDISLERGDTVAAGEWMLRALDALTGEEAIRYYTEMGWLLADGLVQHSRYADGAAILAKSLALAEKNGIVIESYSYERINRITAVMEANLNDPEVERRVGESWTTEVYIRNLKWFARRISAKPAGIILRVSEANGLTSLTRREREILQLLIDGQSTRGMAEQLSVSPRTITTHIGNIMAKMGVSSRAELVAKALRSG